jgi:hypothetical protein
LNPYLKDDGTGYLEESDEVKVGASQLLSSSVVGDRGASWSFKACTRASSSRRTNFKRFYFYSFAFQIFFISTYVIDFLSIL